MFYKSSMKKTILLSCLSTFSIVFAISKNTLHVSTIVTEKNFAQEILQSTLPVIVKVSAAWCTPCQRISPVFESVAAQYDQKCKFASMDFDANQRFVAQNNIDTVPTFLVYYQGKLIGRQVGCAPSITIFTEFVESVLNHVASIDLPQ